jgi:TP901 family phage tail tape measure protein
VSIQLEDLVARVRLDTSGVDQGLGAVQSSVSKAGANLSSAGRKMSLGITAPLAGIAAVGVKMAADFDLTMRKVAIATGGPTKALSDLAIQMGAETAFSASEASQAMLELAKGGMTAAEIQAGALEQTMRLASAGDVALGDSATYVANAMNTFGLKAKDADEITTALAGAANASSASVQSLGQGLAQGALAARNAGLNLQETTGVLSLFDAAGLKGSDAGTSLKAAMNSLIPTTTKAKNAMKDANLDFVDAEGNFRNVADIAGQLHDRLGPLSEAQRQVALETIFGSDGMRAATILMNGGRDAVEKYTKASRDEATTTALADAAMEGLSGSLERAKGSMETAALMVGQVLAPYIEKLAGVVEQAANFFTNLPGPMQGMIVAGGALVAVIGPILVGLGFVVSALGTLMGLFAGTSAAATATGAAVATATFPLWAIVAALAAVGVGLYLAYQRSAEFRQIVQDGMAAISTAVSGMAAVVMPIVNQVVGVFKANLPQIKATATEVFASVKQIVQSAMVIIVRVIEIATGIIKAVWDKVGNNIINIIEIALQTVLGVVRGAFTILRGIFQTVAALLQGDWQGAWDGIKTILSGAWKIITSVLEGAVKVFWEAVKAGLKLVLLAFQKLPGLIVTALSALTGLLFAAGADMIRGLIDGIKSMAGAAAQAAIDVAKGALDGVKGFLKIGSPSKVFRDEVGKMIGQGMIQGIVGTKADVRDALGDLISTLRQANRDGLARMVSETQDHLLKIAGKYSKVVRQLEAARDRLKDLNQQARDLAHQVRDTIVATGDISEVQGATDEEGNVLPVTFDQILAAKTAAAEQAAAFASVIQQLRSLGLSEDQVQTLLAKGPAALEVAQAMLSAGAAGIAALNSLQTQIVATGTQVGKDASEAMYGAGIEAAEGLIKGLETSETRLAKVMRRIARQMVKALKDALDIHSPSRVFRELGSLTGQGYVLGLEDQVGQALRAARALVSAPSVASSRMTTPTGLPNLGGTPVTVLVSIGNEQVDAHVETVVGEVLSPLTRMSRQKVI